MAWDMEHGASGIRTDSYREQIPEAGRKQQFYNLTI